MLHQPSLPWKSFPEDYGTTDIYVSLKDLKKIMVRDETWLLACILMYPTGANCSKGSASARTF